MADLPDLNKNDISFIAYWNAIDQGGVSSIDPSEVTSASEFTGGVYYDNGIEGYFTLTNGRQATVRIKNDGWLIAYLDTEESYATEVSDVDLIRGHHDLIHDWDTSDSAGSTSPNTLTRAVSTLKDEFSNSGSMAYGDSQVSLYNYQFSGATTTTHLSFRKQVGNKPKYNLGILWTAGTTRHRHIATCSHEAANTYAKDYNGDYIAQGNPLAAVRIDNTTQADQADTEHTRTIGHNSDNVRGFSADELIIWS